MQPIAENIHLKPTESIPSDGLSREQILLDFYNARVGPLKGYNCNKCLNRGYTAYFNSEGDMINKTCECMKLRKRESAVKASGLAEYINRKTFESFKAEESWQEVMKMRTEHFAEHPSGWLFVAGQTGCGKTHLCTAVCREMIMSDRDVSYMKWSTLCQSLRAVKFNDAVYENRLQEIKNVDVLYIDDFFKQDKPDKEIAYEIIDARYISKKTTIITSEYYIEDLMNIDEAIAGRIKEMSGGNTIQILKQEGRNYRLRGVK